MKEIHLGLEEKVCGEDDMATGINLEHWECLAIDLNIGSLLLVIKLQQ